MAGDLGSIVIFWSRFPQQDTIKSLDEYQFLRTEKQSSLKCETQINSHNGRRSKAQALLCGQAASPLRILRAAGWVSRWKMLCWTWFNSSSYTCGGRLVCNDCWLVWAKIERDHRTVDGQGFAPGAHPLRLVPPCLVLPVSADIKTRPSVSTPF